MKKLFTFLIILSGIINYAYAQQIFSNGTGGGLWSNPATWLGGIVPGTSNDVIIAGTDSVLADGAQACANLTVLSGGKIATGIDAIAVSGATTLEAESFYYNAATSPALPGIAVYLDPASTVVHIGSGTIGSEINYEFGNLIMQRTSGVSAVVNLIINGDLTLNMAAGQVFRGAKLVDVGSLSHTVYGNVYINKGVLSCIDVGAPEMSCVWDIKGSVYVTDTDDENFLESRLGPFSSANADGLGIINVGGDLIIDGGRLQAGTSSTAGPGRGIINLAGNMSMTARSNVATNSIGPFSFNFNGSDLQTVHLERMFSMNIPVYDTIKAGSTVMFDFDTLRWQSTVGGGIVVEGALGLSGNSMIRGAFNFTVNPDAELWLGSQLGLQASDTTANLNISGTRTFSPEGGYGYIGTTTQVPGDGLPQTVANLFVNNSEGLVLFGNYTVTKGVDVYNGYIDLNSNTLTLADGAALAENAGSTVRGNGKIVATSNVNSSVGVNVGGLGASIGSALNLGSTTVERTHSASTQSGKNSITRIYNIMPSLNSGLGATLRIYYDESELNGLDETKLSIYQSATGAGDAWVEVFGTVNTADNYVEVSGLAQMGFFTLFQGSGVDVETADNAVPAEFALLQNYPNPFNPETTIRFDIASASHVNISIYNSLGEKIAVAVNEYMEAGKYKKNFDASSLPSGLYIYKLNAAGKTFSGKMMLLK